MVLMLSKDQIYTLVITWLLLQASLSSCVALTVVFLLDGSPLKANFLSLGLVAYGSVSALLWSGGMRLYRRHLQPRVLRGERT